MDTVYLHLHPLHTTPDIFRSTHGFLVYALHIILERPNSTHHFLSFICLDRYGSLASLSLFPSATGTDINSAHCSHSTASRTNHLYIVFSLQEYAFGLGVHYKKKKKKKKKGGGKRINFLPFFHQNATKTQKFFTSFFLQKKHILTLSFL